MAGVTINGFVPKRFNEIVTGLRANAKPIFQDLVKPGEEVDTGDTSTIGRLIGLISLDLDELWQAAEQVYQAFDPNSATGVALDNIVQYMGVTRRLGNPTVLRTSVWGETGVYLSAGQTIRGTTGTQFASTTELTFNDTDFLGFALTPTTVVAGQHVGVTFIIDEGIYTIDHTVTAGQTVAQVVNAMLVQFEAFGLTRMTAWVDDDRLYIEMKDYYSYMTVPTVTNAAMVAFKKRLTFNSIENGDFEAPLNTVTTMLTPVFGWTSVTNEISAEKGSVYETDEELRERFRVSKAVRAQNTSEALYSRLLELEDVSFVRVYENMTNATDIRGIPAHSFMAIVRGGIDLDIGEVVWNNKPLGIASYGNTSVIVRDSQNMEREVKFSRPVEVPVYVRVVVSKTDNNFPDTGIEDIRTAVVNYINNIATFGESVIYTRLFTPINSIPGHQVNELKIGRSVATLNTNNLPMTWEEFPVTSPELVTVILED